MTSGSIWSREAIDYMASSPGSSRPANYPAGVPGNGSYGTRAAPAGRVINVMDASS
jgi:hypothetical protein